MRFPSPTPLPPSDVALIAAYEAERGVTLCPAATYTEDPFVPVPLREQIRRAATSEKARVARANRADFVEARRRRIRILDMLKSKTPHKQIAAFAGVSIDVIANDAKMLRKEGRL